MNEGVTAIRWQEAGRHPLRLGRLSINLPGGNTHTHTHDSKTNASSLGSFTGNRIRFSTSLVPEQPQSSPKCGQARRNHCVCFACCSHREPTAIPARPVLSFLSTPPVIPRMVSLPDESREFEDEKKPSLQPPATINSRVAPSLSQTWDFLLPACHPFFLSHPDIPYDQYMVFPTRGHSGPRIDDCRH